MGKIPKIGKFLKKLRVDLGVTQREIAEELGTTFQMMSLVERGHRKMSGKLIKKFQEVYKLNGEQYHELLVSAFETNGRIELSLLSESVKKGLIAELERLLKDDKH